MNLTESSAKPLLAAAGIPVPRGTVVRAPEEAERAARDIGPCAVKAQVPAGGRGKAGGIRLAATPADAAAAATDILGMEIGGHAVDTLLVEAQARVGRECYCAAMIDPGSRAQEGGAHLGDQLLATVYGAPKRHPGIQRLAIQPVGMTG